jgi:nucleoside-diphosphate-sugar epimerase
VFGDHFEEPERRVPNISKITKVIDWQPRQSLDEIILEIADYMRNNDS